jgi:Fe-S oxidoreductase/nitrate reductase gamma subunit
MPTGSTMFGISGAVWLRLLFLISVGVFAWRMVTLIQVLRQGRPDNRLTNIPLRIKTVLKEVLGQSRLFEEPTIGWAHPLIFWGVCLFFIASPLMLLGGMFPSLPVPQAEEIPILGTLVDCFALLVLIGLAAAAVRRYFFTPRGLERTWDASLILILITGLMITYLLAEAGIPAEEGAWRPAGNGVARLLGALGVSAAGLQTTRQAAWWIHVLILLGFLVYLPFSKHMHLIFSPFAVFFAELPDKGTLSPSRESVGLDSTGSGESPLARFTWRMLLSGFSCAECGRCERACPAATSGSQLSPKTLIHDFKKYILDDGIAYTKKRPVSANELVGSIIKPTALWGCTTCYACMERCPVRNEHVPIIVEMRRRLMEKGELDTKLQEALTSLQRYGNSLGKSPRKRGEWAKDLPVPVVDARKNAVDTLWFVGDYASYHASASRVSRMTAQVFHAAGIHFGILHDAEKSAGNDVRRTGEEGLFEMLAEQNMKGIEKAQCQRIVTTDPHTYHALTHDYRQFGLNVPVFHYAQILDEAVANGTLRVKRSISGRAVYHDPCYLGRMNGIYDPPRRVIDFLGIDRVELPRNRTNSFCCGAGGGKYWMEEEEGIKERPEVNRIREALDLDGVSLFVVACPKDLAMFGDAVKTVGGEDRLRVVDLGELVYEAIGVMEEEVARS